MPCASGARLPPFGMPSHFGFSVSDAEATGLVIGLNQHTEVPVNRFDDRSVGLDHVGFSVAERVDLDVWQKHLAALDVVHSPAEDAANGAALVFRYPDNIQLEFWWPRKRSGRVQAPG